MSIVFLAPELELSTSNTGAGDGGEEQLEDVDGVSFYLAMKLSIAVFI